MPSQFPQDEIEITRRSGWSDALAILGVLNLLGALILLLIALNADKSGLGFEAFVLFAAIAVNCFLFAFLVNVFTDIRWYLRQLNLRLESLAEKTGDRSASPAADSETVRKTQLMAEMATQLKNLDNPKS